MPINPSGISKTTINPLSNRVTELEKQIYELKQEIKDIKENLYKIVFSNQNEIENNK